MRLYNPLKQYFLFILLVVSLHYCHGHEHHNQIDPVATKYSQSTTAAAAAPTIDSLSKSLDTKDVPKADIEQHHDDNYNHDTIDARLRAKQDLRNSIDRQSANNEDNTHETEEYYINRLNEPLENEYKNERQPQNVPPSIADNVHHTLTQNQSIENAQILIPVQNETLSSLPPSSSQIPTKQPEHAHPQQASTQAPPIVETVKPIQTTDEKRNVKAVADEAISAIKTNSSDSQLPNNIIQQNIVKEDVLVIQKDIPLPTQSHQQEANHHGVKPTQDHVQISTDQQPPASNPTINNFVPNNNSPDIKSPPSDQLIINPIQNLSAIEPIISPPTPVKLEQPIIDPVQNLTTVEPIVSPPAPVKSEQPIINPAQNLSSIEPILSPPTPIKPEQLIADPVQNLSSVEPIISPPTPVKSEEDPQVKNPVQNIISADEKQRIPDIIQNNSNNALDKNTPHVQIVPVEMKPVEIIADKPRQEEVPPASKKFHHPTPAPPRILRSATSRIQQKAQARHRQTQPKHEPVNILSETENTTSAEDTAVETIPSSTDAPPVELSSSLKPIEPRVDTAQQPIPDDQNVDDISPDVHQQATDTIDLPRQVHVHDSPDLLNEQQEEKKESLQDEIEQNTTSSSFLAKDYTPHLPRILENDDQLSTVETMATTITTNIDNNLNPTESSANLMHIESKDEETNNSNLSKTNTVLNSSEKRIPMKLQQVCWSLPATFEPSLELVENEMFRFINVLPEFLQTLFFARLDNPEIVMNTLWFGSICVLCLFFSVFFLTMATKRLRRSKDEKAIRARCQQLQQYNNQIELERATFERQNQKLSDEIDELKNLPVRDTDEDLFELKELYNRLQVDLRVARTERDGLQQDLDHKHMIMQKHEFDMQKQIETVASLNNEILQQKQDLAKERGTIARLQSNDLSLERFENLQKTIHDLQSELTQLNQDKFAQVDELQELQERANQFDVENNQLTTKMKQLKDLLEQREETIARIREKMVDDQTTVPDTTTEDNQELLSTIDNDVKKANQHMRQLHTEIDEKTRRIKSLDSLLNQEKDRCREMETKLKVVLELRERDAHLHIRQLGQTDAELRKARTDTERVRILQQQLELKQQQLDDVQKVLTSEQSKFSEECSKLQHETHEKWMEVKRLTRELDTARKECEGLRRQITKYANSERSSQEKSVHKPVPQHMNNTGRVHSDAETNGSSPPPPLAYQQGDNFRPIDHQRNDSGAASPAEMFRARPPPMFGMPRPPFFPPQFLGGPPPNPFMMGPRFAMPLPGPHGMMSPIAHLMTNGSAGGSDANSFEAADSTNITPNSTSYDVQLNGSAVSPTPEDEQPTTAKTKKPKKSLKKKKKTPTTAAPVTREDV